MKKEENSIELTQETFSDIVSKCTENINNLVVKMNNDIDTRKTEIEILNNIKSEIKSLKRKKRAMQKQISASNKRLKRLNREISSQRLSINEVMDVYTDPNAEKVVDSNKIYSIGTKKDNA